MIDSLDSALPWVALAVVLFWSVGAYNRLVRLRSQAISAFGVLDGRFSRFTALVDDSLKTAQPGAGLASNWAGLQGASTQFEASLRVARRQPLDANAMAALQTAHATMQVWWSRMQEAYFEQRQLMPPSGHSDWTENVRLATHAMAEFNRAVLAHNEAIAQFPALLLARLFGFRPAGCL